LWAGTEEERIICAIEGDVRTGKMPPPLIAVSEGEQEAVVLVEGHKRATAYVRALASEEVLEIRRAPHLL
jgi:hypothetical protein